MWFSSTKNTKNMIKKSVAFALMGRSGYSLSWSVFWIIWKISLNWWNFHSWFWVFYYSVSSNHHAQHLWYWHRRPSPNWIGTGVRVFSYYCYVRFRVIYRTDNNPNVIWQNSNGCQSRMKQLHLPRKLSSGAEQFQENVQFDY